MSTKNKKTSAAGAAADVNGEVLLVRFTQSPTRKFSLAYNVGEEAEFPIAQAAELIEAGFAEAVGSETEENA
jgi:hypothetical protein